MLHRQARRQRVEHADDRPVQVGDRVHPLPAAQLLQAPIAQLARDGPRPSTGAPAPCAAPRAHPGNRPGRAPRSRASAPPGCTRGGAAAARLRVSMLPNRARRACRWTIVKQRLAGRIVAAPRRRGRPWCLPVVPALIYASTATALGRAAATSSRRRLARLQRSRPTGDRQLQRRAARRAGRALRRSCGRVSAKMRSRMRTVGASTSVSVSARDSGAGGRRAPAAARRTWPPGAAASARSPPRAARKSTYSSRGRDAVLQRHAQLERALAEAVGVLRDVPDVLAEEQLDLHLGRRRHPGGQRFHQMHVHIAQRRDELAALLYGQIPGFPARSLRSARRSRPASRRQTVAAHPATAPCQLQMLHDPAPAGTRARSLRPVCAEVGDCTESKSALSSVNGCTTERGPKRSRKKAQRQGTGAPRRGG